MTPNLGAFAAASALSLALSAAEPAFGQKPGGILTMYYWDSPPSMSIHEEVTVSTVIPMMGVFNNLVLYDQHVPQNNLKSIMPELATEWSWNEDGTQLTFRLREGVKWHDGKPFTAKDVQCTWDLLLGRTNEKLRTNPRKAWYQNLDSVTPEGDYAVTFRLKRPQPALFALLASGLSPVYPCHVLPRDMRTQPVGTGPSNSSSSSRTRRSRWRATRITGSRAGLISTAPNTRSSLTARPRSSPLPPASST